MAKKQSSKKELNEKYEREFIDPLPADEETSKIKPVKEKELSVDVLKASIKNEIFLDAAWKVMSEDDKGSYSKEGENPVHRDLQNAFVGLNKYLASMASQYNEKGEIDVASVVCKGFSIGSNGAGVTLHGTRLLPNGKAFNFNSPFYKWDTEQSGNLFDVDEENDLRGSVNTCRGEVIKYLYKHKYSEVQVNANPNPNVDVDTADNAENEPDFEKPKKRGRKKKAEV